jgi:hypothetical protein
MTPVPGARRGRPLPPDCAPLSCIGCAGQRRTQSLHFGITDCGQQKNASAGTGAEASTSTKAAYLPTPSGSCPMSRQLVGVSSGTGRPLFAHKAFSRAYERLSAACSARSSFSSCCENVIGRCTLVNGPCPLRRQAPQPEKSSRKRQLFVRRWGGDRSDIGAWGVNRSTVPPTNDALVVLAPYRSRVSRP